MRTNWLVGLCAVVVGLSSVACSGARDGADDDVDTTEGELRSAIPSVNVRLFREAHHVAGSCDIYTRLDIHGRTAKLTNAVEGLCAMAVPGEERTYRLASDDGNCGAKIYTGSKRLHGVEHSIKITDNRVNTCDFVPQAQLIVEETIGDDAAITMYSEDDATPPPPPPAGSGVWLTMSPKQCHTNFWNRPMQMIAPASSLNGEAGTVDSYLKAQGIELAEVGFLVRPEPTITCAACSCGRGDELVVKTKNAADADRLRSGYGFSDLERGFAIEPKSCNTNPWDGNSRGTAKDFAQWTESTGADVELGGFVEPTEAQIGCLACGVCARGDRAVAIAKDAASGRKLVSLGLTSLAE